jgi:hypothetical protein
MIIQLLAIFGVTAIVFALAIGFMAVGVMLGRREIQGSCGGLGAAQGKVGGGSCSLCSNPDAACRELARRANPALAADLVDGEADCDRQCEANGCSPAEIEACNPK